MKARDLTIDDIKVYDKISFEHTFSEQDVQTFSELSGDANPLHMDDSYAKTTHFKRRLVHGMLVGSLFSTFVGMYIPGKRCLYLYQTLAFKKPVFINETLLVECHVVSKSESTKVLTLSLNIKKNNEVVLEGEAKVQII